MKSLNGQAFKILSLSWLSFGILGVVTLWLLPISQLTVLIDRSYCPADQWQQLTQNYHELYEKHQQHRLQIQRVVLFSELGEEVLAVPPAPDTIRLIKTYGRTSAKRQARLRLSYPQVKLLTCQSKNENLESTSQ